MKRQDIDVPWIRISARFHNDPRFLGMPRVIRGDAWSLFCALTGHCRDNLIDGTLPKVVATGLARAMEVSPSKCFAALESVGLITTDTASLEITKYVKWQETRAQVEELHARRAAAGRAGGGSKALANAKQNSSHPVASARQVLVANAKQNSSEHLPIKRETERETEVINPHQPPTPTGPTETSTKPTESRASTSTGRLTVPLTDPDLLAILQAFTDQTGVKPTDLDARCAVGWLEHAANRIPVHELTALVTEACQAITDQYQRRPRRLQEVRSWVLDRQTRAADDGAPIASRNGRTTNRGDMATLAEVLPVVDPDSEIPF